MDYSTASTALRPPTLDAYLRPAPKQTRYNTSFLDHSDSDLDNPDLDTPVVTRTSTANVFKESESFVDEYAEYNDPILTLIANDDMDEHELAMVLRTLPLSDKPLVKYVQKAFHVYKSLSRLQEALTTGWEYKALEKNILRAINPNHVYEDEKASTFDTEMAKIVLDKSTTDHQRLHELNSTIIQINAVLADFLPMQYVSDAGVLLTNLLLKIIELKTRVNEKISVAYSQARLISMGADLDELLRDFEAHGGENDAASSIIDPDHPIILNDLAATVEGYKDFVVTILDQLHEAKEMADLDDISECLAVIADLEKMFEALMKEIYDSDSRSSFDTESVAALTHSRQTSKRGQYENYKQPEPVVESPVHGFDSDTLYESDIDGKHSRNQSLSSSATFGMLSSTLRNFASSMLSNGKFHPKTTISEELPYLLKAFDDAKEIENELKQSVKTHKLKTATKPQQMQTSFKAAFSFLPQVQYFNTPKSQDMSQSTVLPKRETEVEQIDLSQSTPALYSLPSIVKPQSVLGLNNPISATNPLILDKEKTSKKEGGSFFNSFGFFGRKAAAETAVAKPKVEAPNMQSSEAVSSLQQNPSPRFLSSSMILKRLPLNSQKLLRKVSMQLLLNFDEDIE